MRRQFASLFLAACLLFSLSSNAFAAYGSQDFTNGTVAVISAEQQTASISGSGKINSYTDTRTDAQKEDDATQARMEELAGLIKQTVNEMKENQGNIHMGEEFGWTTNNPNPNPSIDSNFTLPGFEDFTYTPPTLPTIDNTTTLPTPPIIDYTSSEYVDPIYNLPNIVLPDYLKDIGAGEKDFNGSVFFPVDGGYAIAEQVAFPIVQIGTYLNIQNSLNDKTLDTNFPIDPTIVTDKENTIGDLENSSFKYEFDKDMLEWYKKQLEKNDSTGVPAPGISELISHKDLDELKKYFGDQLNIKQIGDINIAFPTRSDVLWARMMQYLAELQQLGHTTINVTRITVYNVQKYGHQTIKTAVPHAEYHWVVKGASDSVDTYTNTSFLKIMFQAAGSYDVDVFNVQDVIRNNKISGEKTELWVMGNGDAFNGLVLYKHSSAFSSYVSDDIGPTTEEVRLVDDSFSANVTEQMINKIQMIDSNGNIRSPSDGYTTERQG